MREQQAREKGREESEEREEKREESEESESTGAPAREKETCQTLAGAVGNMLIGARFYISFRQAKVDQVYLPVFPHMICDASPHAHMYAPECTRVYSTETSWSPEMSAVMHSRVRASAVASSCMNAASCSCLLPLCTTGSSSSSASSGSSHNSTTASALHHATMHSKHARSRPAGRRIRMFKASTQRSARKLGDIHQARLLQGYSSSAYWNTTRIQLIDYKDTAHRRIGRPRHSPIDACWYGVYGVHGMYGVCVATGDSTRMVSMHHAALSMHHVARHTPHLATPLPTYVHVATAAQNKRAMDE